MKIKLLFQGDSITDAGRSFEDPHLLGGGYVKFAAAYLILTKKLNLKIIEKKKEKSLRKNVIRHNLI